MKEPTSKDIKSRKIKYTPIATDEYEQPPSSEDSRSCGARLLDDMRFQNLMGAVIVANGAVIGMETDMPGWGHWTEVENGFLLVFLFEVTLKICVEGRQFLSCYAPDFGWNCFDSLIVGLGVFDVVASFIGAGGSGGFATVFRMIRLLRILRIFRLLKFLKRLFLLAMGLIEACKAVFWVTILMAFVLYMCSIVLVKTTGRPSTSDPHFPFLNGHFGSILESMITLFVLMSSPNLPIYQEETGLLEGRPLLCIFLIVFITFGSFGMIAMLTGVINQSMFENNELAKEEKRLEHEAQRRLLGDRCNDMWDKLDSVNEDGEVPNEEVAKMAVPIIKLLESAGARVDHGDILKLIEFTDVDDSGTISIDEFVHAMEKIAEGLTPLSMLEVQHAVGGCTRKLLNLQGSIMTTVEKTSKVCDAIEKQEQRAYKAEEVMSVHVGEMGKAMSEIVSRLDTVLSVLQPSGSQQSPEMGGLSQQQQAMDRQQQILERMERQLVEKMDRTVVQTQLAMSEQMGAVGKSMQKLMDRMDNTETRAPPVSQQVGELGKGVQGLSDQIDRSETRVQIAVSQQIGDVKSTLQRLLEQKKDTPVESFNSALAQQMGEIKLSVQKVLDQKASVAAPAYGETKSCLQRTLDEREGSSGALVQQISEMNSSVQRLLEQRSSCDESRFYVAVDEIQGTAKKLLDLSEGGREVRLQLALSKQMEEIGMSVQTLLRQREQNNQGGLSILTSGSIPQQPKALQSSQQIEEICKSVQVLILKEDTREVRLQVLQRAVDATQKSVLGGVGELAGVILGGVAELFAKNSQAMHHEYTHRLIQDLAASHETLRGLLAAQSSLSASRPLGRYPGPT